MTKAAATPGETLAYKVWDTLAKGLGLPPRPWIPAGDAKARADADRQAHLVSEQVRVEQELARQGRGMLAEGRMRRRLPEALTRTLADPHPLEALAATNGVAGFVDRGEALAKLLDLERATALHRIAALADAEALQCGNVRVTAEPVDLDWFARWRATAQDVRSEELQRLWARALVREVCRPGSLSIAALDLLGKLSRSDVAIFTRVAPFIVKGQIFWDSAPAEDYPRPSLDDLVDLAELQVVIGIEYPFELSTHFTSARDDRFFHVIDAGDRCLVIDHDDPAKVLRYPVLSVSRIGMQALALAPQSPNEAHLRALGAYIQGQGFAVSIGSWEPMDGHVGRVLDMAPL
ncbi:MAG TPA: DUF2806 domain-containing protein [Azospirillaceae bacterium]|nr:DUF2806 domain-containing protein [Azospirillaceae bacterium]